MLTFKMGEELNKLEGSDAAKPKRHFYGRFAKDLKQWNKKHFDFMHYTIPLHTPLSDGFRFPSTFVG
jgi:hypothetical protein